MLGYYLFLGRGDWGTSRGGELDPTFGGNVDTHLLGDYGPECAGVGRRPSAWSFTWSLATWQAHIDFLIDELGADTINLLLTGFELPYPSERFPEAVELDHANVRAEFLPELLAHIRQRGVVLIATLSTTGHAVGYARAHPEATTVGADGTRHDSNLCHHHPLGRAYALGVVDEVLGRYPSFDGVCLHPPENTTPCYCEYCQKRFAQETNGHLDEADDETVEAFLWQTCLAFQRELEEVATEKLGDPALYVVTIPGRFETQWDRLAPIIDSDTTIAHWDYWSVGPRIGELTDALRLYQSCGHRVIYLPSSGWSLDRWGEQYGACVREQIAAARGVGVSDIIYFVGGIWHEESLRATALPLRR